MVGELQKEIGPVDVDKWGYKSEQDIYCCWPQYHQRMIPGVSRKVAQLQKQGSSVSLKTVTSPFQTDANFAFTTVNFWQSIFAMVWWACDQPLSHVPFFLLLEGLPGMIFLATMKSTKDSLCFLGIPKHYWPYPCPPNAKISLQVFCTMLHIPLL